MNTKTLSKTINILIYILIFSLSLLILYNFYLIYNNISAPKDPPRNSVQVSPLTGEEVTSVSYSNKIIKVVYNSNTSSLGGLSKASMVFEHSENNRKVISALFLENDLIKDPSMDLISESYSDILPTINFIPSKSLDNYYKEDINSINIKLDTNLNSNFVFLNNYYYPINSDSKTFDFDPNTFADLSQHPASYTNIIVDNSELESDTLLVFSGGKMKKISANSPIYLLQGKTYVITLNHNSTIETSFNKTQKSLN